MNRAAKIIDLWARAEAGDRIEEKDFSLKLFWKNLKQITRDFNIEYDSNQIIPSDDKLIDRIFDAGKTLLLNTGIYCRTTQRVIHVDENEIKEALCLIPDSVVFGEGPDQVIIRHRGLDPVTPPAVLGRVLGPQSSEIIEKVFISFAKEMIVDHFQLQGVMTEVNGITVTPNSPYELLQELKRINYARNAFREVGRPGAHDGGTTPAGICAKIGFFDQDWGKRKTDSHFSHIMPHMMVDYDQMMVAFLVHLHGLPLTTTGMSLVGIGGNPAMCAVTNVAEMIGALLLFQGSSHVSGVVDDYQSETSRETIWGGIHAAAAINKRTNMPSVRTNPGSIMIAGLGCCEHFWEVAASTIGSAVVGCVVQGGTGRRSAEKDYSAGISARFAGEVGKAAIGLSRDKANELVNKCLAKYEQQIISKTLHKVGLKFQECYDLVHVVPTQEHLKVYEKVKRDLGKLGLNL